MFSKLLKYEFKAVRGVLTVLSLAALGAGLIGGLMVWLIYQQSQNLEDNVMLTVLAGTMLAGTILALAAYGIGSWILLLSRFYKNKFSDEGYLTFTLPATTHQILLSSIVNIIIWNIITSLVIGCAIFMMLFPIINAEASAIQEAFTGFIEIYEEFNFNWTYTLNQTLSWLSSGVYSLILPLVSIAIGALVAKKHKLLAAFGIYYGLNMVISIISSIFSVILVTGEYLISGGNADMLLELLGFIPSILQLTLAIAGYFVMHHLVDNKLNLP